MVQRVNNCKTIFYFEDHELDARRVTNALERPPVRLGDPSLKVFHYERALDALKAIDQWKGCPLPDAALLDVDQDDYIGAGIDICVKIREVWPSVPVMFLSGKDRIEDRTRGVRAGAVAYMSKASLNEPGYEELIRAAVSSLFTESGGLPDKYLCGSLRVDLDACDVRWQGTKLRLSPSQIGMVDDLARPGHAGRVRRYVDLAGAAGMVGKSLSQNQLRINVKQRIRLIRQAFERVDADFEAAWKEGRYGIIAVDRTGYRWKSDAGQSEDQSVLAWDGDGAENSW